MIHGNVYPLLQRANSHSRDVFHPSYTLPSCSLTRHRFSKTIAGSEKLSKMSKLCCTHVRQSHAPRMIRFCRIAILECVTRPSLLANYWYVTLMSSSPMDVNRCRARRKISERSLADALIVTSTDANGTVQREDTKTLNNYHHSKTDKTHATLRKGIFSQNNIAMQNMNRAGKKRTSETRAYTLSLATSSTRRSCHHREC